MVRNISGEIERTRTIVDRHGSQPDLLIQILLDMQQEFGWLPGSSLFWLAETLHVSLPQVYRAATFYKAFTLEPIGRHTVQVCTGTACHVRGAEDLLSRVSRQIGIKPDETTDDLRFSLKTVNCLGCCALGPVMAIDGEYFSNPSPTDLEKILETYE